MKLLHRLTGDLQKTLSNPIFHGLPSIRIPRQRREDDRRKCLAAEENRRKWNRARERSRAEHVDLERQARRKYFPLEKPIARKGADSRGVEGRMATAGRTGGMGKGDDERAEECADGDTDADADIAVEGTLIDMSR